MNKVRFTLNVLAVVVFTLTVSSLAQAQATRTWVSGVGDDVNPCSRTAPCKTFAGAISKTATAGEINAIDSGGFGGLTITKSITVDGNSVHAGILAAGVTGINVSANSTAVVILRNLSLNGAGTGLNGISINQATGAERVHIESCQIFGFRSTSASAGRGIIDNRTSANAKLFVVDTVIENNAFHGIQVGIDTGFISSVSATFDHVRVLGNTLSGAFFGGGSKTIVRDSVINGNGNAGIQVSQGAGGTTESTIISSVLAHNTFGVFAGSGASTTRLSDVTITNNGTGISLSGGVVESFGNNNIRANGAGNAPSATPGQQ